MRTLVLIAFAAITFTYACEPNWHPFGDLCVIVGHSPMTYKRASGGCAARNASLPESVRMNATLFANMTGYLNGTFWTGIRFTATNQAYIYESDQTEVFNSTQEVFAFQQATGYAPGIDCVAFDATNATVDAFPCQQTAFPICVRGY